MALELELASIQLAADAGAVDESLAALASARDEAKAGGSELSVLWASTLHAWTTLRRDPRAGIAGAQAALSGARELDYPTACCANLRTIAFGHLALGDLGAARERVAELQRELRERGSLVHARMLIDVAAVLARRAGHPLWTALAATAGSLPPATVLASPGFEFEPLPVSDAPALSMREALRVVGQLVAPAAADAESVEPVAPALPSSTMCWRGDAWELSFAGRSVTVRASKGLTDLAALLAAAGREVHCLDLVGAAIQERSTGEVIDAAARRQYQARIRDLQAVIDAAELDNDLGRVNPFNNIKT